MGWVCKLPHYWKIRTTYFTTLLQWGQISDITFTFGASKGQSLCCKCKLLNYAQNSISDIQTNGLFQTCENASEFCCMCIQWCWGCTTLSKNTKTSQAPGRSSAQAATALEGGLRWRFLGCCGSLWEVHGYILDENFCMMLACTWIIFTNQLSMTLWRLIFSR